jgi:hypothetical protein
VVSIHTTKCNIQQFCVVPTHSIYFIKFSDLVMIFRRVREIVKDRQYLCYRCLSVCPSVLPHGTTRLLQGGFLVKFNSWIFFENLSRKFKPNYKPTKITGALYEYVCNFITVFRWILLRMRNVSDRICRISLNIYFMFSNLFLRIVLFMRYCEKNVVETDRPQRTI